MERLFWFLHMIFLVMRGLRIALWIRLMGGQCGWILVDAGFRLRGIPHAGFKIGNRVVFGPGVKIYVPRSGRLTIGDGCVFTADVFISAIESVDIGRDTLVAEYTSIRDADHIHNQSGVAIKYQGMSTAPIRIGQGAWIGRGVAVLRGSYVGDRAVVGANAVVNSVIASEAVAVGIPARVIKYRIDEDLAKV
jgi:acetyltransferase-like isoleucine patch superfamily enzyme